MHRKESNYGGLGPEHKKRVKQHFFSSVHNVMQLEFKRKLSRLNLFPISNTCLILNKTRRGTQLAISSTEKYALQKDIKTKLNQLFLYPKHILNNCCQLKPWKAL